MHCEFGQSLGLTAVAVRDESLRHFATAWSEIRVPLMIPHKDFAVVLVRPNTMICAALPFHVKS
jgi:hypothetical protein